MEKAYVTVLTHKGFAIQILNVAEPGKGDVLEYIIDNYFFLDRSYETVQEAIDDIDRNEKFIDDSYR